MLMLMLMLMLLQLAAAAVCCLLLAPVMVECHNKTLLHLIIITVLPFWSPQHHRLVLVMRCAYLRCAVLVALCCVVLCCIQGGGVAEGSAGTERSARSGNTMLVPVIRCDEMTRAMRRAPPSVAADRYPVNCRPVISSPASQLACKFFCQYKRESVHLGVCIWHDVVLSVCTCYRTRACA